MITEQKDERRIRKVGLLLLGVCLAMILSHGKLFDVFAFSPFLFFLGLYLPFFLWKSIVYHPLLWAGLTGYFGWQIWSRPAIAANHEYLVFYVAIGVFLISLCAAEQRTERLASMCCWLLVALMSVAMIQKILSPAFHDGSFLALMIAEGDFFQILWKNGFLPKSAEVFKENQAQMFAFENAGPKVHAQKEYHLVNPLPGNLGVWAKSLAWLTIAAEALLAGLFLFRPKWGWTHGALLLFGGTLILMRPEVMFAALFLSLGLVCYWGIDRKGSRIGSQVSRGIEWGYLSLIGVALAMQFFYSAIPGR